MIAYIEVPSVVNELDRQLKLLHNEISPEIMNYGSSVKLNTGEDILTSFKNGWIIVLNGIFKFYYQNKLIRLYSTGDFIALASSKERDECRCISEFGSEISYFSYDDIIRFFAEHAKHSVDFLKLLTLQSRLMHILCACYATEDIRPDMKIEKYDAESVIIAEGDPAKEIYQMIQGKANVTVNGVVVGKVEAGEVFGEISFLTENTRTATVTAETECLVQVMNKNDFTAMIKLKPSVNLAISKTLSQRLIETNKKISEQP